MLQRPILVLVPSNIQQHDTNPVPLSSLMVENDANFPCKREMPDKVMSATSHDVQRRMYEYITIAVDRLT